MVVYLLKSEFLSGGGGVRVRVWKKDAAAGSFAQAEQEGDSVYVGLCLFRCLFWRKVLFCVAAAVVVVVVRVCERLRVGETALTSKRDEDCKSGRERSKRRRTEESSGWCYCVQRGHDK